MFVTASSVRSLAETLFGKAVSANDSDLGVCRCMDGGDDGGDGICQQCDCVIALITRVAHRLGVRDVQGNIVPELRHFPDKVACGSWFRKVLPELGVRESQRLAVDIYSLNDAYEFDAAWDMAERLIEAIFAGCRGARATESFIQATRRLVNEAAATADDKDSYFEEVPKESIAA